MTSGPVDPDATKEYDQSFDDPADDTTGFEEEDEDRQGELADAAPVDETPIEEEFTDGEPS